MPGKYIRGALIEFMDTFLIPLPNIIIFQYNPETMVHTWTQPEPAGGGTGPGQSNPLAVKGTPGESFSFTISMDAGDMIADGSPVAQGLALASGVYTRLAALEMLMYPVQPAGGGLVGSVSASVGAAGGGGVKRSVPQAQIPAVIFVWGPGRIVPVRVTTLTITERLYDVFLNPTHAEAQLGLRVMVPEELKAVSGVLATVASGAYSYSQALRQALAIANLANAAESIIGMLPI